jgi:hypothetical protein
LRAAKIDLQLQEKRDSTTLKTYLPPIRRSHHSQAAGHKSRVTVRVRNPR